MHTTCYNALKYGKSDFLSQAISIFDYLCEIIQPQLVSTLIFCFRHNLLNLILNHFRRICKVFIAVWPHCALPETISSGQSDILFRKQQSSHTQKKKELCNTKRGTELWISILQQAVKRQVCVLRTLKVYYRRSCFAKMENKGKNCHIRNQVFLLTFLKKN